MFRKIWTQLRRRYSARPRPVPRKPWQGRAWLHLEALGERIVPAVTASFSAQAGILSVFGDAQDNTIIVSRDAAGGPGANILIQ
jgi:hypothetical protein